MQLRAREFNRLAEQHYRETLRRAQPAGGVRPAAGRCAESMAKSEHPELDAMVRYGVRVQDPVRFLDSIAERLVADELTAQEVADAC